MCSQVNNIWETLNWIYSNIITVELIEHTRLINTINQLNEYSIIIKFTMKPLRFIEFDYILLQHELNFTIELTEY